MDEKANVEERPGKAALLFGLLGGPVAWAVEFQAIYAVTPLLCEKPRGSFLSVFPYVAVVFAVATSAAALFVARRSQREAHASARREESATRSYAETLALAGMVASAFFVIVSVVQALPLFLLDPCRR